MAVQNSFSAKACVIFVASAYAALPHRYLSCLVPSTASSYSKASARLVLRPYGRRINMCGMHRPTKRESSLLRKDFHLAESVLLNLVETSRIELNWVKSSSSSISGAAAPMKGQWAAAAVPETCSRSSTSSG